jgi:hypothetical protein
MCNFSHLDRLGASAKMQSSLDFETPLEIARASVSAFFAESHLADCATASTKHYHLRNSFVSFIRFARAVAVRQRGGGPVLRYLCLLLGASLCPWSSQPLQATPAGASSDAQIRETITKAVSLGPSGTPGRQPSIRRREDLEDDLSTITASPAGNVLFYDVLPAAATNDDSVWAAVSANSAQRSYRLYRFDGSERFDQLSQDFNRLVSQLTGRVSDRQAVNLARFFLGCCVRGRPGEIVTDEDSLRHAVLRYYFTTFGDVGRMLDAYSKWWLGYERRSSSPLPAVAVENGERRVIVQRVLLSAGKDPQLQEWDLEVSRAGDVRVQASRAIYPKPGHWLFFDHRATLMQAAP